MFNETSRDAVVSFTILNEQLKIKNLLQFSLYYRSRGHHV